MPIEKFMLDDNDSTEEDGSCASDIIMIMMSSSAAAEGKPHQDKKEGHNALMKGFEKFDASFKIDEMTQSFQESVNFSTFGLDSSYCTSLAMTSSDYSKSFASTQTMSSSFSQDSVLSFTKSSSHHNPALLDTSHGHDDDDASVSSSFSFPSVFHTTKTVAELTAKRVVREQTNTSSSAAADKGVTKKASDSDFNTSATSRESVKKREGKHRAFAKSTHQKARNNGIKSKEAALESEHSFSERTYSERRKPEGSAERRSARPTKAKATATDSLLTSSSHHSQSRCPQQPHDLLRNASIRRIRTESEGSSSTTNDLSSSSSLHHRPHRRHLVVGSGHTSSSSTTSDLASSSHHSQSSRRRRNASELPRNRRFMDRESQRNEPKKTGGAVEHCSSDTRFEHRDTATTTKSTPTAEPSLDVNQNRHEHRTTKKSTLMRTSERLPASSSDHTSGHHSRRSRGSSQARKRAHHHESEQEEKCCHEKNIKKGNATIRRRTRSLSRPRQLAIADALHESHTKDSQKALCRRGRSHSRPRSRDIDKRGDTVRKKGKARGHSQPRLTTRETTVNVSETKGELVSGDLTKTTAAEAERNDKDAEPLLDSRTAARIERARVSREKHAAKILNEKERARNEMRSLIWVDPARRSS